MAKKAPIPKHEGDSLEERIGRAIQRLTVVSRYCELAASNDAVDFGEEREAAFWDGFMDLVNDTLKDLEPIAHAPFSVTSWTPPAEADPDGAP